MVEPDNAWVFPAEIHRGDVYRGMPLAVTGNLIVLGSLQPGAQVKAGGSVGVRGEVQKARMEAARSVALLTGCSHSVVQAGAANRLYELSITRVEAVESSLRRLQAVVKQLQVHPAFRTLDLQVSLKPLLQVLVEQSFAGFPSQVYEAIKRCQLTMGTLELLAKARDGGKNLSIRYGAVGSTLQSTGVVETLEVSDLGEIRAGTIESGTLVRVGHLSTRL